MAQVSGDQLEVVLEGGGRDLQVGVGQHPACAFQARPYPTVDPRGGRVIRQHSDCRQHSLLDVFAVTSGVRGSEGAAEHLTDHHGTRELIGPRNSPEPSEVCGSGDDRRTVSSYWSKRFSKVRTCA